MASNAAEQSSGGALYLVSCVSRKRSTRAKAKDLYTSPWFVKACTYVERRGQPWFILSAQYGLVHPETVISPYERTLNAMPAGERNAWARRVLAQLEPHVADARFIVFLAGQRYREYLEPDLRARGLNVKIPMEGLPIGRQLSWLSHQLRS